MAKTGQQEVTIKAPQFITAIFRIEGDSPYCQHKFPAKAKQMMHDKMAAGSQANKGKARAARDFKADYEGAQYRFTDGANGIPASCFRAAMISACRLVGFKMTLAKLSVFVLADGFDKEDHTPLIKFVKGKPEYYEAPARNDNGSCDLRVRPLWQPGWQADVRIRFDSDQFKVEDVANLMARVGSQVGIGEGRPDSKKSCGMGFGTFVIVQHKEV